MTTVRELRLILDDDALDPEALVVLATEAPQAPGHLAPLAAWGEVRRFTAGPRTGTLVPHDEADGYDEGEGEDSEPVLALWPAAPTTPTT